MRSKRAKKLKERARLASLDGSVIGSVEYKKLKKTYTNQHYAPVVVLYPSPPSIMFTGDSVKKRKAKYPFK